MSISHKYLEFKFTISGKFLISNTVTPEMADFVFKFLIADITKTEFAQSFDLTDLEIASSTMSEPLPARSSEQRIRAERRQCTREENAIIRRENDLLSDEPKNKLSLNDDEDSEFVDDEDSVDTDVQQDEWLASEIDTDYRRLNIEGMRENLNRAREGD